MTTYWMYGWHAVKAAIKNPYRTIEKVLIDKRQNLENIEFNRKIRVESVDAKIIDQKVGKDSVHQGIAALVHVLAVEDLSIISDFEKATVVILDQITDPHNMGAIWRSAAAFGVKAIIVPERNSALESGALAKAASGALEILPRIEVKNLAMAIAALKEMGFWVYGFSEHAKESLHRFSFSDRTALIFGSEGSGMRNLTMKNCDQLLQLPTHELFQTLNVSTAAAVTLYEVFRQRH